MTAPQTASPQFLSRKQAAEWLTAHGLPYSAGTLSNLASRGEGPPFIKIRGRACYDADKMQRWVDQIGIPGGDVVA